MKSSNWMLMLMLSLMIVITGCFGSDDHDADPQHSNNSSQDSERDNDDGDTEATPEGFAGVAQAMKEAQKAFTGAQNGEEIEVIDFRALKDKLPSEMAGMERVDASGERASALGFKFSKAEGDYRDGDSRMKVTIIDMGTISGAAMMGFAWLNAEFDRESDSGYERTMKFNGYPAYQKFEEDGKHFEMHVVLGQRVIVQVDGRGKDMDDVEDDMEDLVEEVAELVPSTS